MSKLRRHTRLLLVPLFTLGLFAILAGTALAHSARPAIPAHASVEKAIPAIGSTIAQAPTSVTVFTAENINPDPKKSNLLVYGPTGEATDGLISQGNAKVSLTNPREMSIAIKPSSTHSDGVYVVQWYTVSAEDGDPDQGAFTFTVKSGATAAPTPAPTTAPQSTTPASTTTSSSGGTPVWVPIVVGILALLIGLGGGLGLGLGRRSSARSVGSMRRAIAQQSPDEESVKRP